jgi:alkanesulfonate monooxygenase
MELAIQTMTGYEDALALARWAEAEGVAAFAVADHYLAGPGSDRPAYDQLVLLGGIARETSTIELATLVSPLTFRHPAVMYKAGVTLDEMSGGRFRLGVGAGWMQEEHDAYGLELWEMDERFDRLEDGLAYIRTAIDGGGHDGRFYGLEDFPRKPEPSGLKLVVGGSGKRRTPTLAGTYADEFNVFPSAGGPGDRMSVARAAATDAGRDPDAVLVSTAFPPVIAATADEVDERFAAMGRRRNTDPERLQERYDELRIPFGAPDRFADGLAALADEGVSRVYFQMAFTPLEEVARTFDLVRSAL